MHVTYTHTHTHKHTNTQTHTHTNTHLRICEVMSPKRPAHRVVGSTYSKISYICELVVGAQKIVVNLIKIIASTKNSMP